MHGNTNFLTRSFLLFLCKCGSVLNIEIIVWFILSIFPVVLKWYGMLLILFTKQSLPDFPPLSSKIFDDILYLNMKSLKRLSAAVLPLFFLVAYACVDPERLSVTASKDTHSLPSWSKLRNSKQVSSMGTEVRTDWSYATSIFDGVLFSTWVSIWNEVC